VPSKLTNYECDLAIRASFLHFLENPQYSEKSFEYIPDGLLIVRHGRVVALGEASQWIDDLPDGCALYDYSGRLIMPGFIDCHAHYPQTEMIASYGSQLLEWLENYTFPTELKFSDPQYAQTIAGFYCRQLLKNGTTTSAVYATVHPESVDAIFKAAATFNMRLIAGKVMMDRNAPVELLDTVEQAEQQNRQLIDKWHNNGRALYALTPRFAPCCSAEQLKMTGELFNEFDGLYLQSHVAENMTEVEWVKQLFPDSRSYLDVYDSFGLLAARAIYGHCIHLDQADRKRMQESQSAVAFCPTSNLFLGSGLMSLQTMQDESMLIGLATDVGAGTSFSMLQTLNEAYKVSQLAGFSLSPLNAFYLTTLGAAKALDLEHQIGNFEMGKEADFVVLDLQATELMALRMEQAESIEDQLFALMMMGDDRSIQATHIMGERHYLRE
jgi:guanine deaminase